MIPVQLTLQNFLSYGPASTTLDFTNFRIACLTGDNGHGKSALLDAITYALWGQARKSRQDRKPDDGLLRIGACEMLVELIFDLDSDRYRIIRRYRQRGKTPVSQLELQICDLESGSYHPISESGRISETQKQIEKLLCMDYRTFVNSAFIPQGRSGEFTQNSARERKDILADILGLKRYDQLQIQARNHFNTLQAEVERADTRLAEIDFELQRKQQIEESFEQVSTELDKHSEHLNQIDLTIEQKRTRCLDFETAHKSLPSYRQRNHHAIQRLSTLTKELTHIKELIVVEDGILDRAPRIEARHAQWEKCNRQNQQHIEAMGQLRELEGKKADLERQIGEARHDITKRQAVGISQKDEFERELDRIDVIIKETDTIEKSLVELEISKAHVAKLEIARERHEALVKQRTDAAHKIEIKKQSLNELKFSLQNTMLSIIGVLATSESDQRSKQRKHRLVLRLTQSLPEVAKLRQSHARIDTAIKGWQTKFSAVMDLEIALREKIDLLANRENPNCPLCGTGLDDEHRTQIKEQFRLETERYQRQCKSIEEIIDQLKAKQKQLSMVIEKIEKSLRRLTTEQQNLTTATAHLERLRVEQNKLTELRTENKSIEKQLHELTCAGRERQILNRAEADISALNFDPTDLSRTRKQMIDLQNAVQQYAVIQEARSRQETLSRSLERIILQVTTANNILAQRQYAIHEQQQLSRINSQIDDICYDSQRHQEIQCRLDELADAPIDNERLRSAARKRTDLTDTLKKLSAQEDDFRAELVHLNEELHSLEERSQKLFTAREDLDESVKHADELRSKRDKMLINQGSLQSQIEHFCELEMERKKIKSLKDNTTRDASIYSILEEAFGRNGIQALIIENAIPEIEEEANSLLHRLTDNRIHVSIESLQDLKKGGTKETLDIVISDELGERSYDLYSGGEAFRTDFAIRIALSKVLARRSGTKLRTLIIDEGFGTQDRKGLEHLIDAVHEVSKDFDKLIVVTHIMDLKDAFPVRIDVTKDPTEGSQIRMVAEY